jgi:FKBP-type peptidyl-prolyl cis-trans isomerase
MRRLLLLALVSLPAALVVAPGANAAGFVFPSVSKNIGHKPKIGRSHGAAPKSLKLKDVVVGTGRTARTGDVVATHYVGVLYRGGKPFDDSWDRGQPFPFSLGGGQVIAGWDTGIQGMKVGGRRILVIPARLAYGAQGSPPAIPAHAALIFVVDLVSVTG